MAVVLFAQILGLAVQVKQGTDRGTSRLIRIWAVSAITPFAKGVVHSSAWFADTWHNYVYLRTVRVQNEKLRDEIGRMRLEQVRLAQDASQARRLQTLLGFKEQFISQTMAAQVISTTGSEFSRGVYIDKGSRDGIKPDMPVITSDGIVGKVLRVYPTSSLVLEINDPSSGAGVILEKSRLQGILKGSPSGETFLANIMADETIERGERVLTSGGDRVYPKGLAVGTVARIKPAGTFLNVEVKPTAQLNRLEEVLVITKIVEKGPEPNDQNGPVRAVDVLAQRLPSVPPPKPDAPAKTPQASKPAGAMPQAKPNAEPVAKPAPPPESGELTAVEKKKTIATAAEKNAATAKSVPDPVKPEPPAKDTPR
ncbi:MAG: rod shape-determining protein MreC [Acidobacteriia bacterium]|nr:rod shape-determining protein MreC [Terriglobia bacterium]